MHLKMTNCDYSNLNTSDTEVNLKVQIRNAQARDGGCKEKEKCLESYHFKYILKV